MDGNAFVVGVLSSLVASGLFWALPLLARVLLRLRVRLLADRAESDRLQEEWQAALLELKSRRAQISFAMKLFYNYQRLQLEAEQGVVEEEVVDALVEARLEGAVRRALANAQLAELERMLISRALQLNDGNVSQSAKQLGLSRSALYRRIQRHNIDSAKPAKK